MRRLNVIAIVGLLAGCASTSISSPSAPSRTESAGTAFAERTTVALESVASPVLTGTLVYSEAGDV